MRFNANFMALAMFKKYDLVIMCRYENNVHLMVGGDSIGEAMTGALEQEKDNGKLNCINIIQYKKWRNWNI